MIIMRERTKKGLKIFGITVLVLSALFLTAKLAITAAYIECYLQKFHM